MRRPDVLNQFIFPDGETMHEAICERMMFGDMGKDYNWSGVSEVGMDNLTIGLDSFDYNYDAGSRLWMTPHRWNLLVRQYIDADALDSALAMVEDNLSIKGKAKRGIATMRMATPDQHYDEVMTVDEDEPDAMAVIRTNMVKSWAAGRQISRRWGSCMLSLTFRMIPRPTLTLTSRTTYFGYLAMMDMTVAQIFAKECAKRVGIALGDIQFVWNMNLAQFHGFRCLPWSTSIPDIKDELDKYVLDRGGIDKLVQVGFFKQLVGYGKIVRFDNDRLLYGDETFASYSRIRRRFHMQVMGKEYAQQFVGGTIHPRKSKPAAFISPLWTADLDLSASYRQRERRGVEARRNARRQQQQAQSEAE